MRILLVEDDLDYINSYIAEIEKDYVVDVAYTASDGAYMSEVNDYDAIVVDCDLPDAHGYSLCSEVREANVNSPILFLSDRDDADSRVESLQKGANVCLPKTAKPTEVSAQIKALLQLKRGSVGLKSIKIGALTINFENRSISVNNKTINLRRKEFEILEYLLINRGRTVSKEELLDHIWEDGLLVKSNLVEVQIRNIRLKIEKPFGIKLIQTLRGFGYKID